jgi:ADP-heptose:LPS heptosyltransferase
LRIPAAASDWAQSKTPAGSIHLSINASAAEKEWPLENWVELTKRLLAAQPSIDLVATGSSKPREVAKLRALASAVADARLRCVEGSDIAQLAAILQRCRLHIGADSGVLHLAVALGVPTLSVFREYAGLKEWAPAGEPHEYIAVHCRCISEKRDDCQRAGKSSCLAGISPQQVESLALGTAIKKSQR